MDSRIYLLRKREIVQYFGLNYLIFPANLNKNKIQNTNKIYFKTMRVLLAQRDLQSI